MWRQYCSPGKSLGEGILKWTLWRKARREGSIRLAPIHRKISVRSEATKQGGGMTEQRVCFEAALQFGVAIRRSPTEGICGGSRKPCHRVARPVCSRLAGLLQQQDAAPYAAPFKQEPHRPRCLNLVLPDLCQRTRLSPPLFSARAGDDKRQDLKKVWPGLD